MKLLEKYSNIDTYSVFAKSVVIEAYYTDANDIISKNYKRMFQQLKNENVDFDVTTLDFFVYEYKNIDSLLDAVSSKLYYEGFNYEFTNRDIWRYDKKEHSLYTFCFGVGVDEDINDNFIYSAKTALSYESAYPIRIVVGDKNLPNVELKVRTQAEADLVSAEEAAKKAAEIVQAELNKLNSL